LQRCTCERPFAGTPAKSLSQVHLPLGGTFAKAFRRYTFAKRLQNQTAAKEYLRKAFAKVYLRKVPAARLGSGSLCKGVPAKGLSQVHLRKAFRRYTCLWAAPLQRPFAGTHLQKRLHKQTAAKEYLRKAQTGRRCLFKHHTLPQFVGAAKANFREKTRCIPLGVAGVACRNVAHTREKGQHRTVVNVECRIVIWRDVMKVCHAKQISKVREINLKSQSCK